MSEDMLKWLQFAIDTEQNGLDFYRECREKVRHPRGIELFDFLIKAETEHKRVLMTIFDAISKGDKDVIKKSVDDFMAMDIHNPLFDKETLEKLTKPTAQISEMFNKAIEAEETGIRMYSDLAKTESDPDVVRLLKKLAEDERVHRRELVDLGHFVFGMPVASELGEEYE